ncbi:MAG: patatin-like phospholipase family protein, partial [Gammaproteobacteria bacterium]|nr:patatin-like phospholipase family protein [Gammaproteobacteria bacterium]
MHKTGLVLPGGGARAAYQVGVLKAVAELLPDSRRNPFPIITGTSAGSINAAMLAGHATDYQEGVNHLLGVWENLTVEKIFRTDLSTMLRTNLRWLRWMIFGRKPEHAPRALLSNTPLRKMLETHVRFPRIQQAIDSGRLNAIGITASGYTSARSVTFFQGM